MDTSERTTVETPNQITMRRRLRFVTTKRLPYADEQEVRAILWIIDRYAGINRHFEIDNRVHTRPLTAPPDRVLKGHRRKVDLRALVTEIVVTPWASSTTFAEIEQIVKTVVTQFRFGPLH